MVSYCYFCGLFWLLIGLSSFERTCHFVFVCVLGGAVATKRKIQSSTIMAFSSKLGSLMRLNGQIPMTSMLNSSRRMSTSSKQLFIGGLSYRINDQTLKEAFSSFGDVTEARVILDRDTGRSRGFGFVDFANDESASNALSAMDGQELDGRNIRISYATERPSGPRSFGGNSGFRGDRGGFGGGNRGNSDY